METHEHLEHAEHASHGGDPFSMRVAMSIAIIAAILAGVALLGHKKHNEVIILNTQAAAKQVEKSNGYAWTAATKGRQLEYKMSSVLLENMPVAAEKQQEVKKTLEKWDAKIKQYDKDLVERQNIADTAKQEAADLIDKAEFAHHQAERLDIAHLAVELGLVFCSIAVLLKQRVFWIIGIVSGLVGLVVVATSMMMEPHSHEHHETPTTGESEGAAPTKEKQHH